NSNNCATVFRRCFAIDPNESSTTTYMIVVTSGSGSGNFTCSFTRPSAAAKHRIAWSLDISVNPNTCAVWVDGISQTTTTGGPGITTTIDFFDNNTLYLMSRGGTTLFGAGTLSRFEKIDCSCYPWSSSCCRLGNS